MNISHITVIVILYIKITQLRDSRWDGQGVVSCEVDPILTLNVHTVNSTEVSGVGNSFPITEVFSLSRCVVFE